jgi:hypothetical protein|tara:strand:- start:685 stop:1230 length:546 start_codon:yes stop_codon:yes gene_type:complete
MDTQNLERLLNSFGRQVVREAKSSLASSKGETALGNSIRFEVTADNQGFSTKFFMEDYGTYLDKGVSGNKKSVSYTNYNDNKQSSPYKYTTKGPPIDIISKWIKKKGIKGHGVKKGRSKNTGQFISGFAYLISKKIKREGIKSLSFFQIPLGIGLRQVKDKMLKELKLDIETYLTTYYRPK